MMDRDGISQPWGTRTPYGPGQQWPVRVDSYLADGLAEQDVDTWVRTAAVLHSNGDGMDLAVKDGRIVGSVAAPTTGSTTGASIPRTCSGGRRTTPRTA